MTIIQLLRSSIPDEPWFDLIDICHGHALIPDNLSAEFFFLLDGMEKYG